MNRIRCVMLTPSGETARETTPEYSAERPLYRANDGATYHLGDHPFTADDGAVVQPAPVGAMWDADWLHEHPDIRVGADGRVLVVRTPAGDWTVDQRSRAGTGWTRSGEPPDVTATPSILINTRPLTYHGFLRAGYLEEC